LAQAEAKAHGKTIAQVHFHEVGAIDSIVDILSVAVCLDDLNVTETVLRSLNEGYGTVRCQHGILPIPVPAVANICSAYGIEMQFCDIEGELITPTGAAILAALDVRTTLPSSYRIKATGMGAGKRQYSRPSFLRAMLLEEKQQGQSDEIVKLESNIDDCSPEVLGYVMDRLFEAGALDVFTTPIGMKKFFKTTVHETAILYDTIIFSGGKIGYQIEIPLEDLQKVIELETADVVKE
jgi:uncharacterized protein (DUF111 family)